MCILSHNRFNSRSLHNFEKMADRKAVIKNADMSEEMQQDAVDCATQALEKYNIEKVETFISYRNFSLFLYLKTYLHQLLIFSQLNFKISCFAIIEFSRFIYRRILLRTLKRSLTKSTTQRGTA